MTLLQKILVGLSFLSIIVIATLCAMEYELRKEANADEYQKVHYLKLKVWDVDTTRLINLANEDRFLSKKEYYAILHSHNKAIDARDDRMIDADLESSRIQLFDH